MRRYWISFRLHYDEDYDDRYDSLNNVIASCSNGSIWDQNTSFTAISSDLSLSDIARRLKAVVDPSVDHVVIRRIDYTATGYIGVANPAFHTLFPNAMKF